ncbi:hypothetical protein Hanom_Chr04g00295721 [Helianthus anomalus]
MYIPKNFYRSGGSKTSIPKNFYTKTTCTTLLSEKFGGSGAPAGPLNATPLVLTLGKHLVHQNRNDSQLCLCRVNPLVMIVRL